MSFKRRLTRLTAGLSLAAALALGFVVPALADTVTGSATITGGQLTEVASGGPTFSATLDGTDQTATSSFNVDVVDATGTGSGWKLQIAMDQFATADAEPHTLPLDATSVTNVTAASSGTSTAPVNSVTYPLVVPAGASATPATLFSADANTGMGSFTLTPDLSVSIPANSYAGTYTSTITLSIVSGP